MDRKLCVITGANSGIGKEAARQMVARNYDVIMVCRSLARGEAAQAELQKAGGGGDLWVMQADLSLTSDIRRFLDAFLSRFTRLDVLINNAADFDLSRKQSQITREGMEAQFVTNLLAPHLLVAGLHSLLQASGDGRILNVSSQGLMVYPNLSFDFQHVDGSGRYSPAATYYQTKLGLLMNTLTLRERLRGTGVHAQAIRVTNVRIEADRYPDLHPVLKAMYSLKRRFSISADKMAEVYVELATGPIREGFLFDEHLREVKANRHAYDAKERERLWKLCCEMGGIADMPFSTP